MYNGRMKNSRKGRGIPLAQGAEELGIRNRGRGRSNSSVSGTRGN